MVNVKYMIHIKKKTIYIMKIKTIFDIYNLLRIIDTIHFGEIIY